ncbi:hypothetical protein [Calidifontibacillus oryziterrae]|nr:hypothetical protein [Calidifontibacillus oryziterrae]
MTKKSELIIQSISYVHDPYAAQKWFEIYVEMVKRQLLEYVKKELD